MDIEACRSIALASHHFLVLAHFNVVMEKEKLIEKCRRRNYNMLVQPAVAKTYADKVVELFEQYFNQWQPDSADSFNIALTQAMKCSADNCLPEMTREPHKPWISSTSLDLLDQRDFARQVANYDKEKELKQISKKIIDQDKST